MGNPRPARKGMTGEVCVICRRPIGIECVHAKMSERARRRATAKAVRRKRG